MKKMTKNEIAETANLIEQSINDETLKAMLLDAGEKYYNYVFTTPAWVKDKASDEARVNELRDKMYGLLLEDDMCRLMDRVVNKGKFSGTEKAWLRFVEFFNADAQVGVAHMVNVFALFYKVSTDICAFCEKYGPMMG